MRSKIIALAALLLASPAALHTAESAKPTAKPNILIILADDMGYSDNGYGTADEGKKKDKKQK